MRLLLLSTLILFSISLCKSQNQNYGLPFIKNHGIKEYKAEGPNWAIIKDKRGIMYFANDAGVLEYDGVNWNLIKINALIRSLAVDSSGIIYVGGDNEFGYIKPNESGNLVYISLSDDLADDLKDFSEISSIFTLEDAIYFCSKKRIYKFQNDQIYTIELKKGGFISFYLDKTMYNGDWYFGLMEVMNDSVYAAKNGDFYINKDIFGMIPYNKNEILISTGENTFYIYNKETGLSSKPDFASFEDLELVLKNSGLYVNSVTKTESGFMITTTGNGVFLTNEQFEILNHYDTQSGLQDQTVISSYYIPGDKIESTWLGFYNGLAKFEHNTPIKKIPESYGLSEEVNDIIRFNNELYFATISGIYKINEDISNGEYKFDLLDKTDQNQYWSFFTHENNLYASSYGLYNLSETNVNVSQEGILFYELIQYKNALYAANIDGFREFSFDHTGLHVKNKINDIKAEIRFMKADPYGNLWLQSVKNELFRVNINNSDTIVSQIQIQNGLPKTDHLYFFNYNNKFYFSTDNELYVYNNKSNKIEIEKDMNNEIHETFTDINDFVINKTGSIYISKNINNFDEFLRILKTEDNNFLIDSTTFKRLPQLITKKIYPDSNGIVWFSTSEGIFVFNENARINKHPSYHTFIRKVINNDSVIFGGTYFSDGEVKINQPESYLPVFKYSNNSITFHYAATYYVEEKETEYLIYLEGYDQGWSHPTKITFKEYTNLREGDYTFKVKARNVYGIESVIVEYSFTILPPIYRTTWAFLLYLILFILLVWLLVKLNTRRLQKDKERLEGIVKERTAEVVKQKEEIEQKNKHITDSIEYASRIQQALLPPEEIINESLPDHFILYKPRDIVSGDFYWLKQIDTFTVFATADCTGHGVPGAFMSMLGISFLNEIVNKVDSLKPSHILEELRRKIKTSLRQTGKDDDTKDGMDIAVCMIDGNNMALEFSGAYNPLYLIRDAELQEIKATRNPIGIYLKEMPFENHSIQLKKGDLIYTFSDGYADQFGGEKNSKFKYQNFKSLLLEIYEKPMNKQQEILDKTILDWQKNTEQTDDIIVFGVKI